MSVFSCSVKAEHTIFGTCSSRLETLKSLPSQQRKQSIIFIWAKKARLPVQSLKTSTCFAVYGMGTIGTVTAPLKVKGAFFLEHVMPSIQLLFREGPCLF